MSMYRQLWLSILASMLAALLASQFASLMSARAYLEAQLTMKNRDSATTLALALSLGEHDVSEVAAAAKALFDSGYYDLVQVADPDGKSVLELVATRGDPAAPAWFEALLPLHVAPGQAQVTHGWRQLGSITVLSRSRFAYRALWESALSMAGVMAFAALLGGLLGSLVLGRLRKPMQAVTEQAQAITEHRFVTIAEPGVPELRQLARAMNAMVGRLRQRFEEDAARYEAMRLKANYEVLTGLARRGFFLTNLHETLHGEEAREGSLAVVRVADLATINRRHGREAADDLLRRMGETITALHDCYGEVLAGRLNGTDFALLMSAGCDSGPFLENLLPKLVREVQPLASQEVEIAIGYARFVPGEAVDALLARVDSALAAIEAEGDSAVREADPADGGPAPVTSTQWRAALLRALSEPGWQRLLAHPLRLPSVPGEHLECPLSIRIEAGGEWQPAYRFMPVAERLGLSMDLDLATLALALDRLRAEPDLAGLWLHISGRSLADAGFRKALLERLHDDRELCARLWLEVPENPAMRHIKLIEPWLRELKPLGCHLGMAHCGYCFERVGQLYALGLDFLKVDASFVHGVDVNDVNHAFLAGLCDIAHRIGLKVIAEGAVSSDEIRTLNELGFDGMTGPGVMTP